MSAGYIHFPDKDLLKIQTFTGNGTFNVPIGVTHVIIFGCGAGGGGGSGAAHTSNDISGGTGGNSAPYVIGQVSVTPGASVSVTVPGAGGSGGSSVGANTAGNNGTDGSSSFFGSFELKGGAGGHGGERANVPVDPLEAVLDPQRIRSPLNRIGGGRGGLSTAATNSFYVAADKGQDSERYNGGSPGTSVTTFGNACGGGGGAASYFGVGGNGGNGGDNTAAPTNGASATAYGAGGGGGGGMYGGLHLSGSGGNGGPGIVQVFWYEPSFT